MIAPASMLAQLRCVVQTDAAVVLHFLLPRRIFIVYLETKRLGNSAKNFFRILGLICKDHPNISWK